MNIDYLIDPTESDLRKKFSKGSYIREVISHDDTLYAWDGDIHTHDMFLTYSGVDPKFTIYIQLNDPGEPVEVRVSRSFAGIYGYEAIGAIVNSQKLFKRSPTLAVAV